MWISRAPARSTTCAAFSGRTLPAAMTRGPLAETMPHSTSAPSNAVSTQAQPASAPAEQQESAPSAPAQSSAGSIAALAM